MTDNEGTDSSVDAESSGDLGSPDADATADGKDATGTPSAVEDETTTKPDEAGAVAAEAPEDAAGDAVEVGPTVEDEDELVERVADHDEELGETVEAVVDRARKLEAQVADLEETIEAKDEEIDDLTSRLKRKQADFQNYKKRAKKRQDQIKERATEDLVERLVDVRNDLVRAIESDHEDVESLRGGVEMILREFDRILDDEDVEEIAPDPGDEVNPQRHEVMMRVDSGRPEGAIDEVYDAGYEMAGKVLQPARVTVSNGAEYETEEEADAETADDESAEDETGDDDREETMGDDGDHTGDDDGEATAADDEGTVEDAAEDRDVEESSA
ncbi:MAG: molecular chaperone GrpE [Halobacteriales archaeon]|jgi:molecular chaperone GrpE